MFGTDFHTPGGITSVVRSYRDAGLFERWPVQYIASYRGAGLGNKAVSAVRAALALFARALMGQVKVVHVHSASRGSFWRKSSLLLLGRSLGCRTIFHLHSGEFSVFYRDESGVLARQYIRFILRVADVVVVLTPGWVSAIHEIEPTAKVHVIFNPVSIPPADSGVRRQRTYDDVLFLGRLREKKGVFDLIAAMALIANRFSRARLVLAGDGDQGAVRRAADAAGIGDRIVLPGWVDGAKKQRLMGNAAVFVLPSYFEGLPMGVLEAMAGGTPVIASRVGGIPDVITDGEHGWLVDRGDVYRLADRIAAVLADPSGGAAMAARARNAACERFDPNRIVAQLGALYDQLFENCRKAV